MEKRKTPRIRFKGFSDDWEQRKLGEMADYKKGPFGSALKKRFLFRKELILLKFMNNKMLLIKTGDLQDIL